jgi:ATP-dependent DNA ligase
MHPEGALSNRRLYPGRGWDSGALSGQTGRQGAGLRREGWLRLLAQDFHVVRRKLDALVTPQQRLTRKVRKPKATWVEPKFYAEVEYRDITADGLLRQSAFKGLHEENA